MIVTAAGLIAEPGATLFVVGAAWLTVAGFSRPPYAKLQVTWLLGARAALVLSLAGLAGTAAGLMMRRLASSVTLGIVEARGDDRPRLSWWREPGRNGGLDRRRQLAGVLLVAVLPLITAALVPAQRSLSLSDDLLIYLVGVVGVAVVGGFWPAVAAAVTASMLLNWFFTPPVHTFTIADPQNMLALLLFVTVAVTVSSVVHLAARRAVQAARSREDAAALLALAQTVLGGDDTPGAILIAPDRDQGRQRRARGTGQRPVGQGGGLRHGAGRIGADQGTCPVRARAHRRRADRSADSPAARRVRRPGGRGA